MDMPASAVKIDMDNSIIPSFYDFCSGVDIIPLETIKESAVNPFLYKFIPHKGFFYYMDKQQGCIFVFNENGKFVKKICKQGEGPGEYLTLEDFNFNRFTGNLEILSIEGRIHIYDWQGEVFKETIQVPIDLLEYFMNVNEDVDVFFSGGKKKKGSSKINFYSRKKKEILKVLKNDYTYPSEFTLMGLSSMRSPFYCYQNCVYYHQAYNGAIYAIDLDSDHLVPHYQWDFGTYNFDPSFVKKGESQKYYMEYVNYEGSKYALQFFLGGENDKYLITSFTFEKKTKMLIIDKEKQKTLLISSFKEGLGLGDEYMDNEYIYEVMPSKYLYLIKDKLDEANRAKLDSIDEFDNPVIIRTKFK